MTANRTRVLAAGAVVGSILLFALSSAQTADDLSRVSVISLGKTASFPSPTGEPVTLPAGDYRVGAAPDGGLLLAPVAGGRWLVLAAESGTHDQAVSVPVAISEAGEGEGANARHLLLFLPDGALLEAVGSDGAVVERAVGKFKLPASKKKKLFEGRLRFPAATGTGVAPSASIVVPPPTCTWSTMDIIDPRIDDLGAQKSLMRKLRMTSSPKDRAEGSAMLTAIKNGTLEAIFREFRPAVGTRAVKLGKSSTTQLLSGADATCVTTPAGERPLIVFRGGLSEGQIDAALSAAWNQCGLPTPLPPCDYEVVLKPAGCNSDQECIDDGLGFRCVDRKCRVCTIDQDCVDHDLGHTCTADHLCLFGGDEPPPKKPVCQRCDPTGESNDVPVCPEGTRCSPATECCELISDEELECVDRAVKKREAKAKQCDAQEQAHIKECADSARKCAGLDIPPKPGDLEECTEAAVRCFADAPKRKGDACREQAIQTLEKELKECRP